MSAPKPIVAIIVAAGKGARVGGLPKQWRMLGGKSVAQRSVSAFEDHPDVDRVILVTPEGASRDDLPVKPVNTIHGGDTRQASVCNALEYLSNSKIGSVLIHDAARPLVSQAVITSVVDGLAEASGAAPALPVSDALWRGRDDQVMAPVDREGLYRAQTPQGFHFEAILQAHRGAEPNAADDVAIALAAGVDVKIVPGEDSNFKITLERDFLRAEKVLQDDMDVRLGNGFDVHRFGDGDAVTLCGVRVPHDKGLMGHSDADVAMHALTDAIYGALAEGDIGRHFPPSDASWKGAESSVFLKHAMSLAAEKGFRVGNLDVTILCEFPKIGPHAEKMRTQLAQITGLDRSRISVKATTTEQLGFTGRREGIAASATALVVRG